MIWVGQQNALGVVQFVVPLHFSKIILLCTNYVPDYVPRLKNLEHFKLMSGEEIFTNRKNKFLRIGRNKGFMNNLEDLSSLESVNNSFYETLKLKKFLIPATILLFIVFTLIITFIFYGKFNSYNIFVKFFNNL